GSRASCRTGRFEPGSRQSSCKKSNGRPNMRALSWINLLLGLSLIVEAFTLSSGARPVMAEEIVLGVLIACLAAVSVVRPSSAASWLVAMAGLWTLLAPSVIPYDEMTTSRTNDMVVGFVVLILGIAEAAYREAAVQT